MSKMKEPRIRCCGKKLARGATECPRCQRVTKAGFNANLRKAVAAQPGAAFLGKAAGVQAVRCPFGHETLRAGSNVCSFCLTPMVPVPPMTAANKSAFSREFWRRELGNSPDPALRELLQQIIYQGGS